MADVKTSPAEKSGLADANDRPPSEVAVATESMSMEHYRATVPLWKRILQHSLTQMMLLSVQAFCGPAMADAIAGMLRQAQAHLYALKLETLTLFVQASVVVVLRLLVWPILPLL
jgi:hypothetical protein